jgi:hypothetical protein
LIDHAMSSSHLIQLQAISSARYFDIIARHYARTSLPAFEPKAVGSSRAARHQAFTVEAR